MKIKNIKKVTVKYNKSVVGTLVDLGDENIAFQYNDEWIKTGFAISPYSLKLTNQIYINPKKNFGGLYGVFNDSLPDGWGELLVRRMLAKQGINFDNISPLTRLTLISNNGLGALTYEPCQTEKEEQCCLNLDQLSKQIEMVLNDDANSNLDDIFKLGGSSGGARPKAHLKIDNENWIVKFKCAYDPIDIGVNEYNANALAKKCDINVNEFKLFNSNICSGYFGAKRFDREKTKKIHMISLSSILETTHNYANLDYIYLFQIIADISVLKQQDMYEAFKRMCFNVLYGNKDDHGKNFAFLYDENLKGYKLSPAYDITKTTHQLEHQMMVNGNGNPTEKDLMEICNIFSLSKTKCKNIINQIKQIINV